MPTVLNPLTNLPEKKDSSFLEYLASGRKGTFSQPVVDLGGIHIPDLETYGQPYDPRLPMEDIRAYNQSAGEKWRRGAAKMVSRGLTSFAAGWSDLTVGVINWAVTKEHPPIYDNPVSNWLEDVHNKIDEALPHYYTQDELDNIRVGSANFWADKVGDALGFSLGAIGTGFVAGGARLGSQVGKAYKWAATKISKASKADEILKAARIGDLRKIMKRTGEIERGVDIFAGSLAGAMGESGFEARTALKNTVEQLKVLRESGDERYKNLTDEEIRDISVQFANASYAVNLAIVGGANALMFGKMFVPGFRSERNIASKLIRNQEGEWQRLLPHIAIRAAKTFRSIPYESLQEGLQFMTEKSIHHAVDNVYNPEGVGVINSMTQSMGQALEETYGSKEGREQMLIGAIVGALTGVPMRVLQNSRESRQVNEFLERNKENFDNLRPFASNFIKNHPIQEKKEEAVRNDDQFEFQNEEDEEFRNIVAAYSDAEAMDILIDDLEGIKNMDEASYETEFANKPDKGVPAKIDKIIERAKKLHEIRQDINSGFTTYISSYLKRFPEKDRNILLEKWSADPNNPIGFIRELAYHAAVVAERSNERLQSISDDLVALTDGDVLISNNYRGKTLSEGRDITDGEIDKWSKDKKVPEAKVDKANKLAEDALKLAIQVQEANDFYSDFTNPDKADEIIKNVKVRQEKAKDKASITVNTLDKNGDPLEFELKAGPKYIHTKGVMQIISVDPKSGTFTYVDEEGVENTQDISLLNGKTFYPAAPETTEGAKVTEHGKNYVVLKKRVGGRPIYATLSTNTEGQLIASYFVYEGGRGGTPISEVKEGDRDRGTEHHDIITLDDIKKRDDGKTDISLSPERFKMRIRLYRRQDILTNIIKDREGKIKGLKEERETKADEVRKFTEKLRTYTGLVEKAKKGERPRDPKGQYVSVKSLTKGINTLDAMIKERENRLEVIDKDLEELVLELKEARIQKAEVLDFKEILTAKDIEDRVKGIRKEKETVDTKITSLEKDTRVLRSLRDEIQEEINLLKEGRANLVSALEELIREYKEAHSVSPINSGLDQLLKFVANVEHEAELDSYIESLEALDEEIKGFEREILKDDKQIKGLIKKLEALPSVKALEDLLGNKVGASKEAAARIKVYEEQIVAVTRVQKLKEEEVKPPVSADNVPQTSPRWDDTKDKDGKVKGWASVFTIVFGKGKDRRIPGGPQVEVNRVPIKTAGNSINPDNSTDGMNQRAFFYEVNSNNVMDGPYHLEVVTKDTIRELEGVEEEDVIYFTDEKPTKSRGDIKVVLYKDGKPVKMEHEGVTYLAATSLHDAYQIEGETLPTSYIINGTYVAEGKTVEGQQQAANSLAIFREYLLDKIKKGESVRLEINYKGNGVLNNDKTRKSIKNVLIDVNKDGSANYSEADVFIVTEGQVHLPTGEIGEVSNGMILANYNGFIIPLHPRKITDSENSTDTVMHLLTLLAKGEEEIKVQGDTVNIEDALKQLVYFGKHKRVDEAYSFYIEREEDDTKIIFGRFREIVEDEATIEARKVTTEDFLENENNEQEEVREFLETIYHQVDKKILDDTNEYTEYYLENEEIKARVWNTYKDYLFSDTYPNKRNRVVKEIPVATYLAPKLPFSNKYEPQVHNSYLIFSESEKITEVGEEIIEEEEGPTVGVAPKTFEEFGNRDIKEKEGEFTLLREIKEGKTIGNRASYTFNNKEGTISFVSMIDSQGVEKNEPSEQAKDYLKVFNAVPKGKIMSLAGDTSSNYYIRYKGEEEVKKDEDEINKEGMDKRPLRHVSLGKGEEPQNISELDVYEEMFGNIKDIIITANLIDGKGLGAYKESGLILLYRGATTGTLYHEAFHKVSLGYLSPAERKVIYDEYRKLTGKTKITDAQVNEALAELFREFVLGGEVTIEKSNIIIRTFERILNYLRSLFSKSRGKNDPNKKIDPNKVEELFTKIREGKFKDIKPKYISPRSNETWYKKIEGYSSTKTHSVMQDMTAHLFGKLFGKDFAVETLYDMSKDKKSLPLNDAYDKIKEDYKKFNVLGKDKEKHEENWKKLFNAHTEYLRKFKIRFTEDENVREEERTKSDSNDYIKESIKFSTKDKMPPVVEMMIGSLPQIEFDKNNKEVVVSDKDGFAQLVNKGETINYIHTLLEGETSFKRMVEIMKEDAKKKPFLNTLIRRLNVGVEGTHNGNSTAEFRLHRQFEQQFSKSEYSFLTLLARENGRLSFIDANLSKMEDIIMDDWSNALREKVGGKYVEEIDGIITIKSQNKKELLLLAESINIVDKLNFLENLGIKLTDRNLVISTQGELVAKVTKYLADYIKDTDIVTDLFTREGAGQRTRLRELASMEAPNYEGKIELSHNNAKGENVFGISLNNYITLISNKIKRGDIPSWLDQVFTKSSIWLKKMRAGSVTPKVVILEGLDVERGQGVLFAQAEHTDRMSLIISAVLKGYTPMFRTAEKSLESAIVLEDKNTGAPHYVIRPKEVRNKRGSVRRIFLNYLKDEIRRVISYRKGLGKDIFDYRGDKLSFFEDFFKDGGEEVIDKFLKNEDSINYLADEGGAIQSFLDIEYETNKNYFIENRIVDRLGKDSYEVIGLDPETLYEHGFISEEQSAAKKNKRTQISIEEYQLDNIVEAFTVSYLTGNIEMSKVYTGDLAFYKSPFKRFSALTGTKKIPTMDQSALEWLYMHRKRLDKKNIAQEGNTMYTVVIEDPIVKSIYYKEYLEAMIKSGISEEESEELAKPYLEIMESDGYALSDLDEHREILERIGDWTSGQQLTYLEETWKPGQKKLTLEEQKLKEPIQPLKLQYFGPQEYGEDYELFVPTFYKMAVFPILPSKFGKDSQMMKFNKKMQNKKVGMAIFRSGVKTGARIKSRVKGVPQANEFYNSKGEISDEAFTIQSIPYQFMGIQVDVSNIPKTTNIFGTQMRKLILINLFEDGVLRFPELEEDINEYMALVSELVDRELAELKEHLGLERVGDLYRITDRKSLKQLLLDEFLDREAYDNIIEGIEEIFKEENKDINFDILADRSKVEALLMAVVRNRVIRTKLPGDAKVQAPATGYETKARKQHENLWASNQEALKSYHISKKGKDKGKLLAMEVFLPNYFKDLLPEDITEIPEELFDIIGFRIPTQELNSIEVLIIKGFLPEEAGIEVIVASEIVAKTNADFDIDKLNLFIPHWYKGHPTKDFDSKAFKAHLKEKLEEKYPGKSDKIMKNFTSKEYQEINQARYTREDSEVTNLLAMSKDDSDFRLLANIKDAIKSFPKKAPIKYTEYDNSISLQENSKEAIHNRLIQIMKNLVLNKERYGELVTPLQSGDGSISKKQAKRIRKLFGRPEEPKPSSTKMHSFKHNMEIARAFLVGKGGVGGIAIHGVHHVLAQIAGLRIRGIVMNFKKVDAVNEELQEYSLGRVKSFIKGRRISMILSELISSFVDVAKDAYIYELKAFKKYLQTYAYLLRLGVDIEAISMFFNQPIIEELIKERSRNTALTVKNNPIRFKNDEKIIKSIRKSYLEVIKKELDLTDEEVKDYLDKESFKYDDGNLEKLITEGQKAKKSLKFYVNQVLILKDFLSYETSGESLNSLMRISDHDRGSSMGSAIASVDLRKINKEEFEKSNKENPVFINADKLYSNSFLGTFKAAEEETLDMFSGMFTTETPKAKNVIDQVRDMYKDKTYPEVFERIMKKAKYHFINMLLQNADKGVSYDGKVLNKQITELFFGENSLPLRMSREKEKNDKRPKDKRNLLISEFQPLIHTEPGQPDGLKIFRRYLDKYDHDVLKEAYEELYGENPDLASDLTRFALLQSGLSYSIVSFVNAIPSVEFMKIIKPVLDKYRDGSYNPPMTNYFRNFMQSSLVDKDIVPLYWGKFDTYSIPKEHRFYNYDYVQRWENKKPRLFELVKRSDESANYREISIMGGPLLKEAHLDDSGSAIKINNVGEEAVVSDRGLPGEIAEPSVTGISFEEDTSTGYKPRTRKNASADATIALATDFTSAGEKLTKSQVLSQRKEYIPIDAKNIKITPGRVNKIVEKLNSVNAKTLNIAGNGLYTMKGRYTQKQVDDFTYELLRQVLNSPNLKTKITSIRTGGQTGFDEAGAKAGQRLGIQTRILAPKGWKFRNISGRDISNEAAFKARFAQVPAEPTAAPAKALPGPETKINIYAGTGENAELSNFAERPHMDSLGLEFRNVESAFQYAKTNWAQEGVNDEIRIKLQSTTGAEAKALGRKIKGLNVKGWDNNSAGIMKDIIKDSFEQNPNALQKLLATGNATLTHTQDKGKWGKGFPRILMEVREELRGTQPTAAAPVAPTAEPAADLTAAPWETAAEEIKGDIYRVTIPNLGNFPLAFEKGKVTKTDAFKSNLMGKGIEGVKSWVKHKKGTIEKLKCK